MNEQEKERASLTGEGCPPPPPDLNTKAPENGPENQSAPAEAGGEVDTSPEGLKPPETTEDPSAAGAGEAPAPAGEEVPAGEDAGTVEQGPTSPPETAGRQEGGEATT